MAASREDDLIARHFAPISGPAGLGLLDDAACLAPPEGSDLVVTADVIVESVHFLPDDPPGSVARKALRVNLSDLAAKGAEPIGFLLSLSLPANFSDESLRLFALGLAEDARAFSCPLIGGDTVATPGPLSIAVTALGGVRRGAMIPRTRVRPGDRLYVSGSIGDAALGLRLRLDQLGAPGRRLSQQSRLFLLDRYAVPQPRLALREALRRHAHAAMDVSDGLVGDASKMMRASGVTARIDLAAVPLSSAARELLAHDRDLFATLVTGGDDYEVLASVPADRAQQFEEQAREAGAPVTCIGEARAGVEPPVFVDENGNPRVFARPSFSHF